MVYKASISDLDHWRKWVEEVTPRNCKLKFKQSKILKNIFLGKPKTPEPTSMNIYISGTFLSSFFFRKFKCLRSVKGEGSNTKKRFQ